MPRARFALCALAIACTAHREPAKAKVVAPPARIDVHIDVRDAHAVRATAHLINAGTPAIVFMDETVHGVAQYDVLRNGAWVPLDPKTPRAPECVVDCNVRYTIDLEQVERSFEGVVSVGADSFIAASPTWLVHPEPMPDGAYDITIDGAEEPPTNQFSQTPFTTGLRRNSATSYKLPIGDYYEGSFSAFGHVHHRAITAAGATIEIAIVSDTKLTLSDDAVAKWVREDAECVAQLYGHFPVARTTVFIVPMDGAEEVVFGKVLSLGGASVMALTGTKFGFEGTHGDWVLVHEMTHLGFPTMGTRWLTEGLATYFEPVLRTRLGWVTPPSLWSALARSFPRGIPREGAELALEKRDAIDDVYWGGALFCFMVDVAIRKATSNTKSLEDVMRAILAAGGDATVSWRLPEVIAVAKKVTGTNVFGEFVERFAVRGERIDLKHELEDLGIFRIEGTRESRLDDSAPHAAIRRSIESKAAQM